MALEGFKDLLKVSQVVAGAVSRQSSTPRSVMQE